MKKISFGKLLLVTSILLNFQSAVAGVREGGGGHFVFNSDGSVVIADSYYHNTMIAPIALPSSFQKSVKQRADDLMAIGLSNIYIQGHKHQVDHVSFPDAFDSALYYFVDVIPQVADCALKVNLSLPSGATIDLAACTTGSHTFIKTSDWQAANFDTQVQLLLHERLREFSGKNTADNEAMVMTIVRASNLIESIHSRETQQNFQPLSLPEVQLLETARRQVVNLAYLGQIPNCLPQPSSDYETCFADTDRFAVTFNGGGIIARSQVSNIPESSYFGVGSLSVAGSQVFGKNDRVVESTIVADQCVLEDGVSFANSQIFNAYEGEGKSFGDWPITLPKKIIFKAGDSLNDDIISVLGFPNSDNPSYGNEVSFYGVIQPGQLCHYIFNVTGPIPFDLTADCNRQ